MSQIGWDDQGDSYTAWDRIRDERRAEKIEREENTMARKSSSRPKPRPGPKLGLHLGVTIRPKPTAV